MGDVLILLLSAGLVLAAPAGLRSLAGWYHAWQQRRAPRVTWDDIRREVDAILAESRERANREAGIASDTPLDMTDEVK